MPKAPRPPSLADFRPQRHNVNAHTQRGLGMLDTAMARDGYVAPMTAALDGEILDGSARLERAAERFKDVEPIVIEHDGTRPIIAVRTDIPSADTPEARRIALAANRIAEADLQWDAEALQRLIDETPGAIAGLWSDAELDALLAALPPSESEGPTTPEQARLTLAERFGVPPFSVLDARQGYWQDRKRAWLALGIQSELGRGITNLNMAHPETTSTIDFYAQKRRLEVEHGRELTKDEAADLIAGGGKLKNARAANAARGGGAKRTS